MSQQDEQITEQDILKVFDASPDPFLTAPEIAAELPVTRQAVNYRLDRMREKGLVEKKTTGARSVGWWALVGPELAGESKARVRESETAFAAGDDVALEDVA